MSGVEGLALDADGYVDMDQFPDDGTDLAGADLEQLRDVLHADPVEEPTAEEWDAIFDDVVGAETDTGPFVLDDADGVVPADTDVVVGTDAPAADEPVADDGTDDGDADDGGPDALANAGADDLPAEDVTSDDLDVDLDVGLDLTTDDTVDDPFAPDALDDGSADASDDLEDLL